jgi:hypothetical protein
MSGAKPGQGMPKHRKIIKFLALDRVGRNMYEFGAQLDHEKPFLFHFEDFTERIQKFGNELKISW